MRQRIDSWLFATFARLHLSPRASSRCLPSFASRRRLLGLRKQSFKTPECRYSIGLAALGAKKDYKEMLAKKWRLSTHEDALVLRLNVQANIPKQNREQAGPLTHSHPQPAKWVNFRSFAKACHGKFFYSGFLLFLEQQGVHEYYSFTKKSGAYHTSFNHQRSIKSPSQKEKNVCKSNGVTRWSELEEHYYVASISLRITGTWAFFFLNAVFNHFSSKDISQTNGNWLVGTPGAHFRQKLKTDK